MLFVCVTVGVISPLLISGLNKYLLTAHSTIREFNTVCSYLMYVSCIWNLSLHFIFCYDSTVNQCCSGACIELVVLR